MPEPGVSMELSEAVIGTICGLLGTVAGYALKWKQSGSTGGVTSADCDKAHAAMSTIQGKNDVEHKEFYKDISELKEFKASISVNMVSLGIKVDDLKQDQKERLGDLSRQISRLYAVIQGHRDPSDRHESHGGHDDTDN